MIKLLYTALAWALAAAAGRVLASAGLGLATYAALSTLLDGYLSDVTGDLGLLGDGLQIFLLAGGGQALSIIGGAMVVAVTYQSARVFLVRLP